MKKAGMIRVALFGLLLGVGVAQAEDAFKVGVVDTERVVHEAIPAMKAEKRIEKEFTVRDQEIRKLMETAKELQAKLDKEGLVLPDSERRSKERELSAMGVDLERMQREFREDLNLRKNEELAAVLELANKAIQSIAESGKYDLILQDSVYHNPKIDITDKVIQLLDDESKTAQ